MSGYIGYDTITVLAADVGHAINILESDNNADTYAEAIQGLKRVLGILNSRLHEKDQRVSAS